MAEPVMAELPSPEALTHAILALRDEGYDDLDAYMPYPDQAVIDALAFKPSPIPWFVLGSALFGGALAYTVQWFLNAVAYRLNVGGRPFHAAPAFFPITYEMATLFGALAGVFVFFVLTGLPRLWHPVFETPGFESAAVDGFWVRVASLRDEGQVARLTERLKELGATRVVVAKEAT